MSEMQEFDSLNAPSGGGGLAVNMSKAIAEVQAAMVVAKKFERDEKKCEQSILDACRRPGLAEQALYTYRRGTENVQGPSIRMAEAMAQNWGNLEYGIRELERNADSSLCQAYAWDVQTNTRRTLEFHVPHERHTRKGVTRLTDPRDIYENMANYGARRQRACILAIIPGDIQDMAVAEVHKTLANSNTDSLEDRIRIMLDLFKSKYQISKEMIEARLGHHADAISEPEMVDLKGIYQALRDGMAKREDYFQVGDASPVSDKAQSLQAALENTPPGVPVTEMLERINQAANASEVKMLRQLVHTAKNYSPDELSVLIGALDERAGEVNVE